MSSSGPKKATIDNKVKDHEMLTQGKVRALTFSTPIPDEKREGKSRVTTYSWSIGDDTQEASLTAWAITGYMNRSTLFVSVLRQEYGDKYRDYFPHDERNLDIDESDKTLEAFFNPFWCYVSCVKEFFFDEESLIRFLTSQKNNNPACKNLSTSVISKNLKISTVASLLVAGYVEATTQKFKGCLFPCNELLEVTLANLADHINVWGNETFSVDFSSDNYQRTYATKLWATLFEIPCSLQFRYHIDEVPKDFKKFKKLISSEKKLQRRLLLFMAVLEAGQKANRIHDKYIATAIDIAKGLISKDLLEAKAVAKTMLPAANVSSTRTLVAGGIFSSMPTQPLPLAAPLIPSEPQQGEGAMPSVPLEPEGAPPSYATHGYGSTSGN